MSGMFKPLLADDIEVRIGQVKEGKGASLLLYKTARTDANVLDAVVGQYNWECDYKVINDVLFCGIGIRTEADGRMVWKWDAGSESNVEKDKGEASDAFKRAGFRWGIGRELYTAPFIWAAGAEKFDKFYVKEIGYENGRITALEIVNEKTGKPVFTLRNGRQKPAPVERDAKKPAPKMITQQQYKTIVQTVNEVFGTHPRRADALLRVTGYTIREYKDLKVPADKYDSILSKLTLQPEDAMRVIEEIEHESATA